MHATFQASAIKAAGGLTLGETIARIVDQARRLARPEAWSAGACGLGVILAWPAIKLVGAHLFGWVASVPVTHVELLGCAARAIACLP